jgi:hypothetical protein
MAGLLKSMGFDAEKLTQELNEFTLNMQRAAATINANQLRLEGQGARIEAQAAAIMAKLEDLHPSPSTREVYEDGAPTGVLIHDEKFPQALIDDVTGGSTNGSDAGR